MTDTPAEVAELVRKKLMSRSCAERLVMGARMFDAARSVVIASMPAHLPPAEFSEEWETSKIYLNMEHYGACTTA